MSITLGVYEIFTYTIPGVLFLFTVSEILKVAKVNLLTIDFSNAGHLILGGIISFLIGLCINPLAHKVWYPIFTPKQTIEQDAYLRIVKSYPEVKFTFSATQWPLILAHIRKSNLSLADYFERMKAISEMLEGLSFGFVFLGLIEIFQFFFYFKIERMWIFVLFGLCCFLFSYLSIFQSFRFEKWYYWSLFEYAVASKLELTEMVKRVEKVRK